MTVMEVDGAAVAALGRTLRSLGEDLAALPRRGGEGDGLPPGSAAATLTDLLLNTELARTRLASALVDLGDAAQAAGVAYLSVENDAAAALRTGRRG